jgi:tRNA(Ile)-lysidine synthase
VSGRAVSPERRLTEDLPAWAISAEAELDRRLQHDVDHPLVVALSGGGDSMALLRLAAAWGRRRRRRLLAVTVDHGLNPESERWSAVAEQAARSLGAEWRGLRWVGPKPQAGLPAAARQARHALLAEAARQAGARVILMAHTRDDVAEAERMRAEGSSLGRLRDWAPSPAWPQGRGLMVLRPLLSARRLDLRRWLVEIGAEWIEDPANDDLRFARARARMALSKAGALPQGAAPPRSAEGVLEVVEDFVRLQRKVGAGVLAAALVCAGGGSRPPRGRSLAALLDRLESEERFVAVLAGARIQAHRDYLEVGREVGELSRRRRAPMLLADGEESVWDGRWALTPGGPGWRAASAEGRIAGLSESDQRRLRSVPAAFRGARPVLIRNDPKATFLAGTAGEAQALIGERLALTLDRMTHERELRAPFHGAGGRKRLFSDLDHHERGAFEGPEEPRQE